MTRSIRIDPLTGDEVVLSPGMVPTRWAEPVEATPDPGCPFCPGNETHTPPTIAEVERSGRWTARAFAHRVGALRLEEDPRSAGGGLLRCRGAFGAHEIVVECPDHAPLWTLDLAAGSAALRLARDRLRGLAGDTRLAWLSWHRDTGGEMAHPHAHVVGAGTVPVRIRTVLARCAAHRSARGVDLLEELVAEEAGGERFVAGGAVATLAAWAPAVPFEVWLVPTRVAARFPEPDDAALQEVARAMRRVARTWASLLGRPATTSWLVEAPPSDAAPGFRWHIRMQPRLAPEGPWTRVTGAALHGVTPEEAAAELRRALADG